MHSVTDNQNTTEDCSINDIENDDQFDNEFGMTIDRVYQSDLPINNLFNDSIDPWKVMFAMVNTKFVTMWCLIDSNKKV